MWNQLLIPIPFSFFFLVFLFLSFPFSSHLSLLFSLSFSDSVANNYTPSAQSLSTKIIYKHKVNRSAPPARRSRTTSKKKQEYVVEENVKVLYTGSQSVPGTYSMLSESSPGNMSKSPGGTYNMGFITKGRYRSNQASPTRGMRSKSEADPSETKEIGLDSSVLSHNKPPRLKRVQSAGHAESRTPATLSDVRDSGFHGFDEAFSESPSSKRTRVAWGSTQGVTKSTIEETPAEMDTTHKTPDTQANGFHGDPSVANDGREYDEETISVLNIVFPPASTPTLGLPRAVAPPESQEKR